MSGPKSSHYMLSEAERQRQEEERRRRIEEERVRELEDRISQSRKKLMNLKNSISDMCDSVLAEGTEALGDNFYVERLNILKQELLQQIEDFPDNYEARASSIMGEYSRRLDALINTTLEVMNTTVVRTVQNLKEALERQKLGLAEEELLSQSRYLKREKGPVFEYKDPGHRGRNLRKEVDLPGVLQGFYQQINEYLHNDLLASKEDILALSSAVDDIVKNKQWDDHYKAAQIEMRTKAFLATRDKYDLEIARNREMRAEYDDLHLTYSSLCRVLNVSVREWNRQALGMEASRQLTALREEIQRLEDIMKKNQEASYIADSVNQVMEEMGYDIIATDYMTTPKRNVIHNVYQFDNNLAINVFTSDNGSLMFEVTGVSDENRDPTSLERTRIKEGMETFCEQYTAIKEKLKARGIKLERENLMPADERFAKVLNIGNKKKATAKRQVASRPSTGRTLQG